MGPGKHARLPDDDVVSEAFGRGPLFQRDYWATLANCPLRPSQAIDHIAAHFCEFPPAALVHFELSNDTSQLAVGDDIHIHIRPATNCSVRMIHRDANSFTLGTISGHPEAGRITFGAYRNALRDVILHIRSRARSSSRSKLIGFFAIGDAMQTNTWADFINNAAHSMGARVRGSVHVEKKRVKEKPDDLEPLEKPTFIARGD
jgi:hypothetical protein